MGLFGKSASAAICLLLPAACKPPLLRLLGHCVANGARIRTSLVLVDRLHMAAGARIGLLNLISARRIVMRENAYIANMNVIKGCLSVRFARHAAIGNRNIVNRGQETPGARPVQLAIGTWSKITAGHYVNVGESIIIGKYSVIAGCGTQLWTHGFVHFSSGLDRAEVRGKITVGDNVYIGSHSTLSAGITIGDAVSVGAHSSVAKSLLEPGVYVSQPLRHIALAPEERLRQFAHVHDDSDAGGYYWRPGGGPLPQPAEAAAGTGRNL